MKQAPARAAVVALAVSVVVVMGLAPLGCARAHQERKAASVGTANAEPKRAADVEGEKPSAAAVAERAPDEPVDPLAGIGGDPSVGFVGEDRLLVFAPAAGADDVVVPAFDVACVRGEDALRAPDGVDARFERFAEEQKIALGRVRFVRLERDLATSRGGAPRLCRPVREDAEIYAPLFRQREPAATWLVDREGSDVSAAVRRLVERAAKAGAASAGPPRAIVVRGKVVAVALPIRSPS